MVVPAVLPISKDLEDQTIELVLKLVEPDINEELNRGTLHYKAIGAYQKETPIVIDFSQLEYYAPTGGHTNLVLTDRSRLLQHALDFSEFTRILALNGNKQAADLDILADLVTRYHLQTDTINPFNHDKKNPGLKLVNGQDGHPIGQAIRAYSIVETGPSIELVIDRATKNGKGIDGRGIATPLLFAPPDDLEIRVKAKILKQGDEGYREGRMVADIGVRGKLSEAYLQTGKTQIMVAGGTGKAPHLNAIRHYFGYNPIDKTYSGPADKSVRVVFLNAETDILKFKPYHDELVSLAQKFPDNFSYVPLTTRPKDSASSFGGVEVAVRYLESYFINRDDADRLKRLDEGELSALLKEQEPNYAVRQEKDYAGLLQLEALENRKLTYDIEKVLGRKLDPDKDMVTFCGNSHVMNNLLAILRPLGFYTSNDLRSGETSGKRESANIYVESW